MADCLSVLRTLNIAKKLSAVKRESDYIILGESAWPASAKTNYMTWNNEQTAQGEKEYYTLQTIIFLLNHIDLPHGAYVKQAAASRIASVRFPDRKDLIAFLNGDSSSSSKIDKNAPIELPVQRSLVYQKQRAAQASAAAAEDGAVSPKRARLDEADVQKDRERLEAKLASKSTDHPALLATAADQLKSSGLSKALSKEKLLEIMAKRAAKKRAEAERPVRSYAQLDLTVTRDILARERIWRTRASILQSTGKEFGGSVLGVLTAIKAREEGRVAATRTEHERHHEMGLRAGIVTPKVATVDHAEKGPNASEERYSRFDQERFVAPAETGGFDIDPVATFHGKNLRTVGPARSPAPHRESFGDYDLSGSESSPVPHKRASRTPIIVIPAAPNSIITIYNAKDLLQDMTFVTTEERKATALGREAEVVIQRRKENGTTVPYKIIDSIHRLQPADWDRVVAVFAQGPAWQFKGWPFGGNPVQIFSKIKAFHIKWGEQPLERNIKNWSVAVLTLDRMKRHLDRASLQQFWEHLDKYMAKCKPQLRC